MVTPPSTRGMGWVVYSFETGDHEIIYQAEADEYTWRCDWLSDGARIIGVIGRADGSRRLVTVDIESHELLELSELSRGARFNSISADDRTLFYALTEESSDLWLATIE